MGWYCTKVWDWDDWGMAGLNGRFWFGWMHSLGEMDGGVVRACTCIHACFVEGVAK